MTDDDDRVKVKSCKFIARDDTPQIERGGTCQPANSSLTIFKGMFGP